jgi:hypothetical protein
MAVRPANNSLDGTTLVVAARRSCPPQWRSFMEALAPTLARLVGDEQALQILAGVGSAIAKDKAIPACQSLEDLKAAMNAELQALDWGHVDIYEAERALEFVVVGYPFFEGVEAQTAFAAVFEALLEGWLTQQAARPGLAMRLVERGNGSYPPLVFRYERTGS